ncbi:MAG: tyrosine-type recombinase/integrase [Chloroflexi bacterium]|nr:tyrosine-type recombinase/integrase [Chloroflexota bacterium]
MEQDPAGFEFDELVRRFLLTLSGKSPQTRATYASALARWRTFLEEQATLATWTPARLEPTALEELYVWLVRQYGRQQRATTGTYAAGARAFLRFLARRGLLPTGVTFEQIAENLRAAMGRSSYKAPRVDRRVPLIVTHVRALGEGAVSPRQRLELLRDRAIIQTLFCTGMRRAEVAALNRGDLDDGYADRALITGKGDKERIVFFDQETLAAIRAYLEARGDTLPPLFLRHDDGRPRAAGHGGARWRLSAQSIWGVVKRYAAAAGVPATPHHFRHAKASVLLNRGASLSEVQDILGHASPDTTKRIYAHYETQHLREAFDRFSASADELVAELPPDRRGRER